MRWMDGFILGRLARFDVGMKLNKRKRERSSVKDDEKTAWQAF